jgi:low temperature requirement protein LtrA
MGCPEVGWMELFLDLLFVGYFIVLGKNVTKCDRFNVDSIWRFWANFTLVWGTRNLMDTYLNRFSLSHNLTICAFFLFTGGLMFMILNTDDHVCDINKNPLYVLQGWAAGFLMCRLTILGLLYYTYRHNRKLLGGFMFEGLMITVQSTIVILAVYHPDLIYFVAEMDVVFVPLRLIFNSAIQNIYPAWNLFPYPVNQWKMQERHAVWCVLALGEAIIQLAEINPKDMKGNLKPMYIFTTGTAVMMFAIGGAYFETCCVHEHGTERVHALRRSKWAGAFWTIGQNVLSFGIFLIGPLTSLVLDGYISFELGSPTNSRPFSNSEKEWDNHWEEEIRKKVLLTGTTW